MSALPPDLDMAALVTTWGPISIVAGAQGIWACEMADRSHSRSTRACRVTHAKLPPRASATLREALVFVRRLLDGRETGRRPPIHPDVLARATPFRRAVWLALLAIPRGQTITYAELARNAGRPAAVRAAGGACGANPLPLFIPCHRVVASGGQLGGYSSGLAWKRHLLDLESAYGGHNRSHGKWKGQR